MNITTLAPLSEVQKVEGLNEFETEKRYLHQYNFPGYSVGEAKASRGPGRREIGHGALAEKALIPVLPSVEEFPYAIRSVSGPYSSTMAFAKICARECLYLSKNSCLSNAITSFLLISLLLFQFSLRTLPYPVRKEFL